MSDNGFKTRITKFHYGKTVDMPVFIQYGLKFASLFYRVAAEVRNFLYDHYLLPMECVNARVISVGNITTGGVGKTPVVAEIATHFAKQYGERVCTISRGYGGHLNNKNVNVIKDVTGIKHNAYEAGDEPLWLAENTPDEVIVLTCADRVKAAEFAVNKYQATKIILDDGFQHRRIHRDCDIVLVDSIKKFGNNSVLPFGPLREKLTNLKRADRIFVVSKDTDHKYANNYAKELKKKYEKSVKVCKIEPEKIYNIASGEEFDKNLSATAVCAIGQPKQFLRFLSDINITETRIFDDHHSYTREDFEGISGNIITTEKDAVKIRSLGIHNVYALKLKTTLDLSGLLN